MFSRRSGRRSIEIAALVLFVIGWALWAIFGFAAFSGSGVSRGLGLLVAWLGVFVLGPAVLWFAVCQIYRALFPEHPAYPRFQPTHL